MSEEDAMMCSRIAMNYEVYENGLLFFCPRSPGSSEDRTEMIRLVVHVVQLDVLHHYQKCFKGANKGSEGRTTRSDIISMGEGYIGAFKSIWASVWIVLL